MLSSTTSEYMRVSCAYCERKGTSAVSTAANHAARRPKVSPAPQNATGTAASANSSESVCVSRSPLPVSDIQTCSSM